MSTDDDIILPDAFQREDAREAFCESDDAESDSDSKSFYTTIDVDSDGETDKTDIDTTVNNDTGRHTPPALDHFEGMYRLLDLITEQGSGGTFDKVIIDQASLEAFINDISPGAYKSLTKVDFKKLDQWNINPVGVYGSSEEIMRFLVSLGAVPPERVDNMKSIRSGLYLVKPHDDLAKYYIFYWPEPTTWRDDAIASVVRNRVTFMRYLTKMTDQTLCLLSDEEAHALVWNVENINDIEEEDEDDDENFRRLFTFEVSKTQDQEENVTSAPGFTRYCDAITKTKIAHDTPQAFDTFLPRLLCGETTQAFYALTYKPASTITETFQETLPLTRLQYMLQQSGVSFSTEASDDTIEMAIGNGLGALHVQEIEAWRGRNCTSEQVNSGMATEAFRQQEESLQADPENLAVTRRAMFKLIKDRYPTLDFGSFDEAPVSSERTRELDEKFTWYLRTYPQFKFTWDGLSNDKKNLNVTTKEFTTLKTRILKVKAYIEECNSPDCNVVDRLLKGEHVEETKRSIWARVPEVIGWKRQSVTPAARTMDCVEFIACLPDLYTKEVRLRDAISEATSLAQLHFQAVISTCGDSLATVLLEQQVQHLLQDVHLVQNERLEGARLQSRQQLIVDISNKQLPTTRLTSLSIEAKGRRKKDICFIMCGKRTMETEPMLECRVHPFSYSQQDLQDLSRDPAFVPSPDINARRAFNLHLPINSSILYFHALENDMFLLVLEQADGAMIYLESASTMDNAIRNKHPKKDFHYARVGSSLIFAYDETKRTLAVCNRTELVLHVFTFDEMFKNLAGLGGTRRLDRWYEQVMPWSHACFLPGGEAILLVDYGANARIFSLESEMFRPASITLDRVPLDVFASPDGACMFLTYREPGTGAILVHTYHWSAFGFSEPLIHVAPAALSGSLLLTSIGSRTSVHLIGLDLESRSVVSSIFHITTKATEFQFAERGGRKLITSQRCITANNCLLECHGDVWTRFPVNAPIQCRISGDVSPRRLIFASTCNHANFAPHFSALVQSFEASTRKPTKVKMKGTLRDVLREIKVNAISHEGVMTELLELSSSEFPLGEWLVKLVCLIPIHIAVARNNCFLPLKDGVLSTEWEKSLSGAEVSKIVNSVTLGWYESIFQSYMAQKPVKVVSSMGEQSVGKSYCLNHLVDSSFAGSAMRTTEGVWLSCTPTEDALIVALDFEGVHSPERTAQEDTLLVLFNTAISNLVLFRNNFALSRNITGLFQSFQSSSTVLDPAANPSLFQSTLVIIIKDVAEHDTEDIAREFESKFNHIVKTEKSFNFITRLHNGHLSILPWPVIESRDFYSLFGKMKKELSKQIVTHDAAGEFLLTLKTMMAKLWANDWGAISQTLVAHRAQHLLALLPSAMMYRSTELPPEEEPLKNFDTDEAIPLGVDVHPPLHFWLDQSCTPDDCESVLSNLCQTWPEHHTRENTIDSDWIRDLAAYLQNVVDQRIKLVEAWIHSNMARFKAKHDSITELGREFDRLQVDLRTGVQLCQLKCASCNLSCTMNMRHSPDVLHDCGTTHICRKTCEYDHGDSTKGCGYPAGHSGMHVCHVDAHLCGQPCKLEGKVGCMNDCTQNVAHEGEHLCSSKEHLCGEPCALQSAGSGNHTCERTCTHASNEMHDVHICDNRLCPISCDLCKRLCSTTDHLHGLKHDTIHLCGQEHSCKALCAASGVCEIDTAPQSVSATFTGRHETFEYTKYSQVAKRLKCAVIIPAGQKDHVGSHIHSTDDNPFHFCEAQCKWCGYWCTLPLGHSQTLHNTSHGSMSRTRWAIEPESTLEVNGHKYGADDDGAPMMCNLFCSDMGRHAHMDFCRAEDPHRCGEAEVEHVRGGTRFNPEPERSKDWVSHSLLWRRSGFEDPYSREDRDNFAKCDTMCPDLEHEGGAASYCTLPLFHAVPTSRELGGVGAGYLSQDGHLFACDEPLKQQAYHIIFVIDRSGSMDSTDRVPLRNTPVSTKLQRQVNNRLGAAYSALYSFCTARQNLDAGAARDQRQDAYSVILFNNAASIAIANDFTQDTDAMLDALLQYPPAGGTDFTVAVDMARHAMISYWSADRSPVVLFLSDGESHLPTRPLENLTEAAIQHGIPLSLQTVAFGSERDSTVLRSMASQALEAQNRGRASLGSSITTIDSSYSQAIDTIRLNNTFLSIAESLRKPRGALMRG